MRSSRPGLSAGPVTRLAAPALFLLGLLWLSGLAYLLSWSDMEASVFDKGTTLVADRPLTSLRCPFVITADEQGAARATFRNRADRKTSFLVRSRLTRGYMSLVREETERLQLAPSETRELSWDFDADDAVFDRIVMARVLAFGSAAGPARQSACGVLVLGPSPLPGRWIFALALLAGLVLTGGGAWWWWMPRRPLGFLARGTARRASLMSAIVGAALLSGMLGLWLVSHLLLIAAAGLTVALLQHAYGRSL